MLHVEQKHKAEAAQKVQDMVSNAMKGMYMGAALQPFVKAQDRTNELRSLVTAAGACLSSCQRLILINPSFTLNKSQLDASTFKAQRFQQRTYSLLKERLFNSVHILS